MHANAVNEPRRMYSLGQLYRSADIDEPEGLSECRGIIQTASLPVCIDTALYDCTLQIIEYFEQVRRRMR